MAMDLSALQASLRIERDDKIVSENDVDVEDFVSNYTKQYNNSKRADHVYLCVVQKAMLDVILEQKLKPTATAYFGATMAALDQEMGNYGKKGSSNNGLIGAMLSVLGLVLPKVPQQILRSRFSAGMAVILRFFTLSKEKNLEAEENSVAFTKSALHCLQCFLQASEKNNWLLFKPGFDVVLNCTIDAKPKVRKKAQVCLLEIFASIIGSPFHTHASESFFSLFENLMVDALSDQGDVSGKGKASMSEESKSGQKSAISALHMLGSLRQVLPLLSLGVINKSLIRLTELYLLHQPMVTRQVLDCLNGLLRSTASVSGSALGEALGRILSEEERNLKRDALETRTVIQTIQLGIEKLFEVDRNIGVKKLPIAFLTLVDKLASEQEEVIYVAADSLRSLISTCIDSSLVAEAMTNQGLTAELKSGPSAVERICVALESSLQYQYSTAWDMSLLLVAAMFDKLGPVSSVLMSTTVSTLGQLQELPDSDLKCRKQLHLAVGAAIGAMGPESFLSLLPLNMDGTDAKSARIWLLPVLKRHTVGSNLVFFLRKLMPLAGKLREKAKKAAGDDKPATAKNAEALVFGIWSLLPAVSNYAQDIGQSFKLIAKPLGDIIAGEPELRPFVCQSLQKMINQNRKASGADVDSSKKGSEGEENDEVFVEEEVGPALERAREKYTPEFAAANLAAMAAFAKNFLPLLFNAFVAEEPEKRGEIQATIAAFVTISNKAEVKSLFVSVVRKLLESTKEHLKLKEENAKGSKSKTLEKAVLKRCTFMDLATSMAAGIDRESSSSLYAVAKAAIQDSDPAVQKRAYKLIARFCEVDSEFVQLTIDDLLENILENQSKCVSSTKRHRLVCIKHIILHVLKTNDESKMDAVSSLLTEIVLALKESNTKTRNVAYDLLIAIPKTMAEVTAGSGHDATFRFFSMVAAGLGGTTPHMIGATVMALSRLLYEYSMDLIHTVPQILPTVLLLLRSRSREIIKPVLGFVKVVIARLPGHELEAHVPELLQGLLLWCEDSKNHFKLKVRVILERLVRRCGQDLVARHMPAEHMKLLTHIRKTKEREQRKRKESKGEVDDGEKSVAEKSRASTARKSEWAHTDVFSDDDISGDESNDEKESKMAPSSNGKSKNMSSYSSRAMGNRRLNTRLPEDDLDGDEPLDLLDATKTRQLLSAPNSVRRRRDERDDDDDFEIDGEGKMLVTEDDEGTKRAKKRRQDDEADIDGDRQSSGGKTSRANKGTKANVGKSGGQSWVFTGDDYKPAKRGKSVTGGDIKKQGKLDPHAYWPLDPKMLNRREAKKNAARKGMSSVVQAGKQHSGGNASGSKPKFSPAKKGNKVHKGKGKAGQRK